MPRSKLHFFCLTAAVASTAIAGSLLAAPASAQEASGASATKISASAGDLEAATGGAGSAGALKATVRNPEFADSRILTDAKLKAEEGSLSRYSFKGSLSWYGPPVGDLSASDQPNVDGVVRNNAQRISGSLMARYRIDSNSAINFGTGISAVKPLHGLERVDANNPFVSFSRSRRSGALQMRHSIGASVATVPVYTALGEVGGASVDNDFVYDVGSSRLSLAVETDVTYWFFSRTYVARPINKGGDGLAQQWTALLAPGFRYRVTDALNVSGSVGISIYNPRLDSNHLTVWSAATTLRLGLGYAVTRDVFLNPYVSAFASRPSFATSSLNLATIWSL